MQSSQQTAPDWTMQVGSQRVLAPESGSDTPESTTNLMTPSAWSPILPPPTLSNDHWWVSFPLTEPHGTFRTRR